MIGRPLSWTAALACLAAAVAADEASARGAEEEPGAPLALDAPVPTRTVSLREALAYARDHQPAIRAALGRVRERLLEAEVPTGQWLPTVGATAQLFAMTANNSTGTYVPVAGMDLPRIGGTSAQRHSLVPYASTLAGVGLTQELFDFGRIGAERAAADDLVAIERHSADAAILQIDFGVEEAFFSVLAAKAVARASDEAYARSKMHRDLAQRGVGAGLRSPIEQTRAEADLARFDVGRVRARGGVLVAQTVLSAAMGASEAAVDATGDAPQLADMPTLGRALSLAQEHDPVLARALAALHAAKDQTRAVGAALRPDLAATGTVSVRAGGAPPTTGAAASGGGLVPNVPNWDIGVVLSWPLFDGVVVARRDAARSLEDVRRDEVDARREEQAAAVREGYVQVSVARSALGALETTVAAARANYAQADARFTAGMGTAVELADAEQVRAAAEIDLALGQFELARARAAFGRLIAEGL